MTTALAAGAASAPASAASTAIPFKPAAAEVSSGLDLPVALAVCVVLLVVAIVVLRRWGPAQLSPQRRQRAIDVLESTRLRDKTCVSLIRYRGRELLVAHSEHAIAVLASDAAAEGGEAKP